jgi:hypothetical protein
MITTRLNRSLANRDPEGSFENPLLIVDEMMFTRGEKIATLNRWREAILDEVAASGLGERARILREIEEARHRLSR